MMRISPIRRYFLFALYLIFLLEMASRAFLVIKKDAPFFAPQAVIYKYYPEVKDLLSLPYNGNDVHVLLLGASTLTTPYGKIGPLLKGYLETRTKRPVKVYNLAEPAQTSLDSYYKYALLKNRKFDLVFVYDGFNEVRANNCPENFFRKDYSHMAWYAEINTIMRHPEMRYLAFPYVLRSFCDSLWWKAHSNQRSSENEPTPEAMAYGETIKTSGPIYHNLKRLLDLARQKKEKLVLMTFAFYISPDYSFSKFKEKKLDYVRHKHPVELWGTVKGVTKGLASHNEKIRQLAGEYPEAVFVDQENLLLKSGKYFDDVCHLSKDGCRQFVINIAIKTWKTDLIPTKQYSKV